MTNLQILPIRQILFLFLFASFGIHELFLFLFVQKLAPQIYSYSYLREKYLLADHWTEIKKETKKIQEKQIEKESKIKKETKFRKETKLKQDTKKEVNRNQEGDKNQGDKTQEGDKTQ